MLKGRLFITGGTGSLGTRIIERANNQGWRCDITVYSRDEVKQSELKAKYPQYRYVLGDIRDYDWLTVAMRGHDLVIHAAAYKQVVSSEVNAGEAIETNVIGSRNVARAAVLNNIPTVIGISSDKSCAPVNLYGCTKACMEKLFQQACLWDSTNFLLVRYGNVIGSRGSVVPVFRQQAATSGIVTVTSLDMTRFWLTLDEAINLILEAEHIHENGTILIPKCHASSIRTLVAAIVPDAKVTVIGIRPGEKVHEQLVHGSESYNAKDIGDYFQLWPAYTSKHFNVEAGFSYASNTAPQLTVEQLVAKVMAS
jgi:UDP-N-acetylglucosamine 4,6-dehydratase